MLRYGGAMRNRRNRGLHACFIGRDKVNVWSMAYVIGTRYRYSVPRYGAYLPLNAYLSAMKKSVADRVRSITFHHVTELLPKRGPAFVSISLIA
jgi:hypothetical protein